MNDLSLTQKTPAFWFRLGLETVIALGIIFSLGGLVQWGVCNKAPLHQQTGDAMPKRLSPNQMNLLVTDWTRSYQLYHHAHAIWLDQYAQVGANQSILTDILERAKQKWASPEIVIYSIPLRDLGQSSEGGFSNYADYLKDNELNAQTIREFVKKTGLTPRVYLEPDALSLALQYREDNHFSAESVSIYQKRMEVFPKLIRLYQDAGAFVYLEGAHSDWFDYGDENIAKIAATLNEAGIASADGLVTNVSNRQPLAFGERNEWHYIKRLLPQLNNKKLDIVVDTSRNGGTTHARKYWLSPDGLLIDNETSEGRLVGSWKRELDPITQNSQVVIRPFYGKPKLLSRLLQKEKYQYNLKKSILTAPGWLDPVGDVQPGPAPTDSPSTAISGVINRLRYVKPPDDCDGAINCPAGASKSLIIAATQKRQANTPILPEGFW